MQLIVGSFLANIAASFIASVVFVLGAALFSSRARWLLTGVLGHLLRVDIEAVYDDKTEAGADLSRELARAHDVAILTGRGNELQRDTFYPLFLKRPAAKDIRVRILLPITDRTAQDWTQQREDELAQFDPSYAKRGLLKEQIQATSKFLEQYIANGQVELRRFSMPHVGRIVITDRCVFFTPYREDSHGRDCSIYKYRRGDMYDSYARFFEQLWNSRETSVVAVKDVRPDRRGETIVPVSGGSGGREQAD